MPRLCELILIWELSEFWLSSLLIMIGNNSCSSILHSIQNIRFPLLVSLYLIGNKIESLEGFHRIYFPQLSTLCLGILNLNRSKPFV